MTSAKGGRPATGSIKWRRNAKTGVIHWHAQISLVDGSRPWKPLDPRILETDRPGALAFAKRLSDAMRARGRVADTVKETVEDYAKRWCTWREGRKLGCVKDDRAILRRHVLDVIGPLDVCAVTRDDLKRLVSALDAKVRRGETIEDGQRRPFGWKTACNAWMVVRALFRDARGAKDVSICVREDNPADGVAGPDIGAKKAKGYLWPSEFQALVSCARVPLRWRRLFALAVYTYARAGELAALRWDDVDLEHGAMHIHRSEDKRRGGGVKATKSDTARRPAIETALRPLLAAMHSEAGGKGPVVRLPGDNASRKLRMYLRRAGVTRADLFVTDATRKAITFHDLRATGITWCAVRGDEPLKIMQRAGHENFETTKITFAKPRTWRRVSALSSPPCRPSFWPPEVSQRYRKIAKPKRLNKRYYSVNVWPLRGLNPDTLSGCGF